MIKESFLKDADGNVVKEGRYPNAEAEHKERMDWALAKPQWQGELTKSRKNLLKFQIIQQVASFAPLLPPPPVPPPPPSDVVAPPGPPAPVADLVNGHGPLPKFASTFFATKPATLPELARMSEGDLRVARNELFAKYGRPFSSDDHAPRMTQLPEGLLYEMDDSILVGLVTDRRCRHDHG